MAWHMRRCVLEMQQLSKVIITWLNGSNSPDNRPVCLQPSAARANYVELRIFLYLELIGGIRTICLYGDILWPAYSYLRLSQSNLCK